MFSCSIRTHRDELSVYVSHPGVQTETQRHTFLYCSFYSYFILCFIGTKRSWLRYPLTNEENEEKGETDRLLSIEGGELKAADSDAS